MEILVLLILILINAFFSAAEMALITVNDAKIYAMAEDGDKKARLMQKLLKEPSKFLATIQVGVTFAGFLASSIASQAYVDKLAKAFNFTETIAQPLAVAVITLILSYFTLVLGELVPKRIAMNKPEKFARFAVGSLLAFSKLTRPISWLLSSSTNVVAKIFGVSSSNDTNHVTEEEIRLMVDVGEEKGDIDEMEKEMINNIFDFNDQNLTEIMTHRTKVVGIPVTATMDEVMNVLNTEKFSRIPVYEDSLDDIIGILHIKDLLPRLISGQTGKFNLRKIARTPLFVPVSREPHELFKDMKRTQNHMAVVIDEYGGTAGIITLEDLLEEIVGNIFDEYDEQEKVYEVVEENKYIFKGGIEFDTFCEIVDYTPEDDEEDEYEYDTLSGFIIGNLGRIPADDEQPEVEVDNFLFKVLKVEDKQIIAVSVIKFDKEETDDDDNDEDEENADD